MVPWLISIWMYSINVQLTECISLLNYAFLDIAMEKNKSHQIICSLLPTHSLFIHFNAYKLLLNAELWLHILTFTMFHSPQLRMFCTLLCYPGYSLQAVSLQSDNLMRMIFTEMKSGCELYQEGGCVSVRVDYGVAELNGMLHILDTESMGNGYQINNFLLQNFVDP
jgi:hypothetical protein